MTMKSNANGATMHPHIPPNVPRAIVPALTVSVRGGSVVPGPGAPHRGQAGAFRLISWPQSRQGVSVIRPPHLAKQVNIGL